ncbi:lantibiotic ABC transporter permease, partial [Streptococcus salivarius]|nr:lantibiotic ABC transporter permease [Streptococcus salivarius]
LLNSPLSVLSFSISLYLLPYFLDQIFREGLAQKLLYLFPINQQSVGKLLGLLASNRGYFFHSFIINSLSVFSFLIGLALLLKIVSYFHAKNWKFA